MEDSIQLRAQRASYFKGYSDAVMKFVDFKGRQNPFIILSRKAKELGVCESEPGCPLDPKTGCPDCAASRVQVPDGELDL